ncbi:MAG: sigma 54-interacting transcriptional regulator [Acidobacteria bacterium]|nr:sigma 54-interacting transcriptional regulator [Acidobacteriota bacterium]
MAEALPSTENLLRELAEGTAATTGQDFLRALVSCAARALNVTGVWVTEYLAREKALRATAFWLQDRFIEDYRYSISGTPCELVIESARLVHYPERVIDLFPNDRDLVDLNAVSYTGIPFMTPDGMVIGHFSALDTKPFHLTPELEAVFRIFASRAGAEILRLRTEAEVRNSEQRYARLFASAMDAIFELDHELHIRRANEAAAKAFRLPAEKMLGRKLTLLLGESSARKLLRLAEELDAQEVFSWVPGGLQAQRGDATAFPAEASLSRFEWQGAQRYCVILRSVEDQLAAENRLRELEGEAAYLQSEIAELRHAEEIAGRSPAMLQVISSVQRVAPTPSSVLITGETGTGKELVARALHRASQRAERPFIRVNCAAIPAALSESEFFGHEKGAFTGAVHRRVGRFELAHGGTIFLDEIGELPLDLQAKLLRVLQEGEFEPVGSSHTRKVDVRVIAATNRDLHREVEAGRFREDLFYRLHVFPIAVPALRERGADVELLADIFLERYCRQVGRSKPKFSADCLRRLRAYSWPGNVRELENVMERAVILCRDDQLALRDVLPLSSNGRGVARGTASETSGVRTRAQLKQLEKETLVRALEAAAWKVAGKDGAAQALGIPASTLASRMKVLGIRRPR